MKTLLLILSLFGSLSTVSYAASLQLTLFISGFYAGSGQMVACSGGLIADTIVVEFHDSLITSTIYYSSKALLYLDGTVIDTFPNSLIGTGCYIGVKHRNSLETWSRPVTISSGMSYNFSTANSQSCGDNTELVDVSPDVWAIRQGDVNQDGKIDINDSLAVVNAFGATGYRPEDLTCNGVVDSNDCKGFSYMYYTPVYCTHFNTSVNYFTKSNIYITVSPNPATNLLTITTTTTQPSEIILYDIASRQLMQEKFSGTATLNIEGLAKGVYLYEVRDEKGVVKQGKVVKE